MNKMFVVMILAGLLVFGCTGQPSAPSGGAASSVGAGAGSTVAAGGQPSAPSGGAGAGTSPGAGGSAGAGDNAAAIATYSAAMAAGIPLECTVTVSGQPMTIDIRGPNMYMKGQAAGETYEIVYTNGASYMKLSTDMKSVFAQLGKNCDWLMMAANDTSTSGGTPSSVSADSVQAPDVTWSCAPGLFNDDRFLTPGSKCSMSDLYPTAGSGAGALPGY